MIEPAEWSAVVRSVFRSRAGLVREYADILGDQGIEWGLIGPREADRLWERHILNSLCVVPWVSKSGLVADVGSGAGLPGIVVALACPQVRVDLVEPMARRVEFLRMCAERLGLDGQVRVVRSRAEDYEGQPSVVVCRAVASVEKLVGLVGGLVPPAELLAIKGEKAADEVAAAKGELRARGLGAEVCQGEVEGKVVGSVVRVFGA